MSRVSTEAKSEGEFIELSDSESLSGAATSSSQMNTRLSEPGADSARSSDPSTDLSDDPSEAPTLMADEPRRAYAEEELLGSTLGGKYTLDRLIGRGGMGAVYGASMADGRQVAVKLVLIHAALNPEARARFMREARAAAAVDSNHVVRLIDAATDDVLGTPFMVMELLDGMDLKKLVKERGPIRSEGVVKLGLQACEGLAAAHASGIIHRDIKPANLFLSLAADNTVTLKICDFGIAKRTARDLDESGASLTQTGGMLGTPIYTPPEQAMNAKNVDVRSDVWSLCLSMYKALAAGRLWPKCETHAELLLAICTSDIRPLSDVAPWVDPALARVVMKGLRRDPDERWNDTADLAQALRAFSPNGGDGLTLKMLKRVPREERRLARAAPAASQPEPPEETATDPGTVGAFGNDSDAIARPKRSATPALAFFGLCALGAAAWLGLGREPAGRTQTVMAEAADAMVASLPTANTAAPAASANTPAVPAAVFVTVKPPGAKVTIDGKPAVLTAGKLSLRGNPGDSFRVSVNAFGRTVEQLVVILRGGRSAPDVITVKPTSPRVPPVTAPRPGPRPGPTPGPTPAPTPAPAKDPGWTIKKSWGD